jgi:carbonic anhydrase
MKKLLVTALLAGLVSTTYAADHGAQHWNYTEAEHWGDSSEDFALCKLGKSQAPINIDTKSTQKSDLPTIKINYKSSTTEIVNNGHTIQINLADAGSATVPGGEYKIVQFHFHTPSEEEINGKHFAMVAHLVHENSAGNLDVIAVLFKKGKENAALKEIFEKMPHEEGKVALDKPFDIATILPKSMDYYAFTGSLTTPPCSEGVAWQVLKQPVELSAEQISAFQKIFKMNARPVQPLNGRKVQESS